VGASLFPRDGQSVDELLDAADRALYKMKRRTSRSMSLARVAVCL
jgi:GGDEF domain-containing protein